MGDLDNVREGKREMTGRELVAWIQKNKAENMQIVVIDDGYAIFPARPEVRENEDLRRIYINSAGLEHGKKSVVM